MNIKIKIMDIPINIKAQKGKTLAIADLLSSRSISISSDDIK
jgi:hypothetical protein